MYGFVFFTHVKDYTTVMIPEYIIFICRSIVQHEHVKVKQMGLESFVRKLSKKVMSMTASSTKKSAMECQTIRHAIDIYNKKRNP